MLLKALEYLDINLMKNLKKVVRLREVPYKKRIEAAVMERQMNRVLQSMNLMIRFKDKDISQGH